MKVFKTITIEEFNAWGGAKNTKQVIIDNNKEADFERLIDLLCPDGIDETTLNDILWFDDDWVYLQLGIEKE